MEKKVKKVFMDGPISPSFIMESISKHASKHDIGAHSIFLGQVRADSKEHGIVSAIHYEAYMEMADLKLLEIREAAFQKFPLTCMHIYHSLGEVKAGEISIFVFTSSVHRVAAMEACTYIVDQIKSEAPIWGKEILQSGEIVWKVNN